MGSLWLSNSCPGRRRVMEAAQHHCGGGRYTQSAPLARDDFVGSAKKKSCPPRPPYSRRGRGVREFAIEISLTSFGSSQILPFPHLSTEAASRFCRRSETPIAHRPTEPAQRSPGDANAQPLRTANRAGRLQARRRTKPSAHDANGRYISPTPTFGDHKQRIFNNKK